MVSQFPDGQSRTQRPALIVIRSIDIFAVRVLILLVVAQSSSRRTAAIVSHLFERPDRRSGRHPTGLEYLGEEDSTYRVSPKRMATCRACRCSEVMEGYKKP